MLKLLSIIFSFQIFLFSQTVDLSDKNLEVDLPKDSWLKTKQDYEKEQPYEKNPNIELSEKVKKKENLEIDTEVGINKDNLQQPIDKVKVNVGTKF